MIFKLLIFLACSSARADLHPRVSRVLKSDHFWYSRAHCLFVHSWQNTKFFHFRKEAIAVVKDKSVCPA